MPSRVVYPAPQQVPCFQCYQMCECVHMCFSATAIKTSPECNSHTTWLECRETDRKWISQIWQAQYFSQSYATYSCGFTSLVHIGLPFQMFLPSLHHFFLSQACVKPSKCCPSLFLTHTSVRLSLEPVQTLYLCLNLLTMIDDIDKTCLKATKAEFP